MHQVRFAIFLEFDDRGRCMSICRIWMYAREVLPARLAHRYGSQKLFYADCVSKGLTQPKGGEIAERIRRRSVIQLVSHCCLLSVRSVPRSNLEPRTAAKPARPRQIALAAGTPLLRFFGRASPH